MTTCSPPAQRPAVRIGRVQLLANSAALRTALRRALAASGATLTQTPDGELPETSTDEAMRPDAVVLDTALQGLHGLALVRRLTAAENAPPVVVVAPDTAEGRGHRTEALSCGATGFVLRPDSEQPLALREAAEEIAALLARRRTARAPGQDPSSEGPTALRSPASRVVNHGPSAGPGRERRHERRADPPRLHRAAPQVLVVASSTGGPQALIDVFRGIPPGSLSVPVLVVQHMPAAFTPILAEHLGRATRWRAVEATADEPLAAGEIRIAPGGNHLVVAGSGADRRLRLTNGAPVNFCRPSADVLFVSAAEVYGRNVLAVILTGMGNDGCEGARVIAAAGGTVFAQDRATSVVWGMPGAAVGAGVVHRVLPLDAMSAAIQSAMTGVV